MHTYILSAAELFVVLACAGALGYALARLIALLLRE